jgi:hypothetical protein
MDTVAGPRTYLVVGDRKREIIPTPRLPPDVRRKSASTSRLTIIQQLSFLFFVWGEVVVLLQGVFARSCSSRETTETVFSNTPVPASCGAIKIAFSYLLPVFPFHHRSHVRSVSMPFPYFHCDNYPYLHYRLELRYFRCVEVSHSSHQLLLTLEDCTYAMSSIPLYLFEVLVVSADPRCNLKTP